MNKPKKVALTGDRPTGPLHLGHYVGSLKNRLVLQETMKQFVMIADVQALTDNAENPEKVRDNVLQVALDYLAVGIDPEKTTIFIQSLIPEIAELALFFFNLVSVARLQRNPTVKDEIVQRGFGENLPVGFFVYPLHQVADITIVKANVVPVGNDQLPMIEQAAEVVRKFNRIYAPVLVEPEGLVPTGCSARLPGTDGKAKMSKSLGNTIYLSDTPAQIEQKVMNMFTDPNHLRVSDPGKVEGNAVFSYLDIFDQDTDGLAELKAHYQRGGLGDVAIKKRLCGILLDVINPIATRGLEFAKDPAQVMAMLKQGTARAREVSAQTMKEVREAMKIAY